MPSKNVTQFALPLLLAGSSLCAPRACQAEEPNAALSSATALQITRFVFKGNTVFTEAELTQVLKSYLNRNVTEEDLEEARRALTQFYVQHGYVNSGAILENQTVENGTVTFKIIEGVLKDVAITGNHHFNTQFLKRQIQRGTVPPLNVITLRDSLELLRQNPNVEQLNANVQPGAKLGEANLQVAMVDRNPVTTSLEVDNHRPPSVGAERLRLNYTNTNLTGWDDRLDISSGLTRNGLRDSGLSGLHDFVVSYRSQPFFRDTRLQFNYTKGDTAVIEEPFQSLNITSKSENVSVGFRQPLHHTLTRQTDLTLSLEHRKSESFLFGIPFSFSEGDDNGVAQTTALRLGAEYLQRGPRQVFAARGLISYGDNFGGSTKNPEPPNGRFVTFLGQLQHVRVLDEKGRQLVTRVDGQLSNNPLLSVEKFAIGGAGSVRGYRENQLVRDSGIIASTELRVPVLYDKIGRDTVTLAPFFDYGYGKDKNDGSAAGFNSISSLGVGILFNSHKRLDGQLYWGYALRNVQTSGHDLQDDGIHFALSYKL